MTWLTIDQARDYLGGRDRISRKVLYGAVKRGLRVARLGESGRRILFAAEWIDEYLRSTVQPDAEFRARRAS